MADEHRGRKPAYMNGKTTPPQPGDEQCGEWPRERLITMNEKFRAAMEHALARGFEQQPVAKNKPGG
jgi:hypothetical protein